jgi:hypothetical protein
MLKKLGGRFWAGYEARSVSNTVKFWRYTYQAP